MTKCLVLIAYNFFLHNLYNYYMYIFFFYSVAIIVAKTYNFATPKTTKYLLRYVQRACALHSNMYCKKLLFRVGNILRICHAHLFSGTKSPWDNAITKSHKPILQFTVTIFSR